MYSVNTREFGSHMSHTLIWILTVETLQKVGMCNREQCYKGAGNDSANTARVDHAVFVIFVYVDTYTDRLHLCFFCLFVHLNIFNRI